MDEVYLLLGGAFLYIGAMLLYRIVRFGRTGALFNSRIERTLGQVSGRDDWSPKPVGIKVHRLGDPRQGLVGLEFERFNGKSWRICPLVLSRNDAEKLSELLAGAARRY